MNKKEHWDQVFTTRLPTQVSWFQPDQTRGISLVEELGVKKSAGIIDVGGGDSHFAEALLRKGYQNIHVLDISSKAIERAKVRLAGKAADIKWIRSDVVDFRTDDAYDLWHDRAAFHFIITEEEITKYVDTITRSLKPGGHLILATFSTDGPEKCSGLEIKQYDAEKMTAVFSDGFKKIRCFRHDHITPAQTTQNFQYCLFRKKSMAAADM